MLFALGYDLCGDERTLDSTPAQTTNLTTLSIANGIFDEIFASRNITQAAHTWDYDTIMWANFDGNLYAGNVEFAAEDVSALRIKRRKKGDFAYTTLFEIPISSAADFDTARDDHYARNLIEYEYAAVPVVGGIEGNYITRSIQSCFNGIYLTDADHIYNFMAGAESGAWESVSKVGQFVTGSKYPITIEDGDVDYLQGNFSSVLLPPAILQTRDYWGTDRTVLREYGENALKFIKNKKLKIWKDWNGRMYLVKIIDGTSIEWLKEGGFGLAKISFNIVEAGNPESGNDLYDAGLISVNIEGL